ncbi:MAG: DEAD/DEAH box helicase [Defluviitaleaceae bacterium]|nr:DEAD/DEAH box helicase [Defluviitaleaceae bacterium]
MNLDFNTLIGGNLTHKLAAINITEPTEVQQGAIPLITERRDLIAQSPTGTGKTLAFLLPIIARIDPENRAAQAIVVAPTHELAVQIAKVASGLTDDPESVALLIGSASKPRQLDALKKKPRIIVGSLGRILDFIAEKKLSVHHVKTLVFDEADRLIDDKSIADVERLIKSTLKERQILLFSAKIPDKTRNLAETLMKNPEILMPSTTLPANIIHYYIETDLRSKFDIMRRLIHGKNISAAMIFVNRPFAIEKTADRLNHHKLSTSPLYGTADRLRRKQALDAFRNGRTRLLVASDIAARGLDIGGLSYVINLDLPDDAAGYLHRAGRCGRMGAKGEVFSIVTAGEAAKLRRIAKELGFKLVQA